MAAARQICDVLRRSTGLQIAVVISKPNHLVLVAHIDPLRIRPRRIKGNPIRTPQSADEDLHLLRLSVAGHSAENTNSPGIAFRQENIPVGGGAKQSWIVESGRILLDLEAHRRYRPGIRWSSHRFRTVFCGLCDKGLGKIVDRNFVGRTRLFVAKIREGRRRRRSLQS